MSWKEEEGGELAPPLGTGFEFEFISCHTFSSWKVGRPSTRETGSESHAFTRGLKKKKASFFLSVHARPEIRWVSAASLPTRCLLLSQMCVCQFAGCGEEGERGKMPEEEWDGMPCPCVCSRPWGGRKTAGCRTTASRKGLFIHQREEEEETTVL